MKLLDCKLSIFRIKQLYFLIDVAEEHDQKKKI